MKFSNRSISAGLLAAAAFALLMPSAQAGGRYRDLNVDQQPIADFGEDRPVSASAIQVSAWLDRQDATYRPGDAVTLQVKASRPAYITVLDIGTSGRIHVIYPNRYQQDNRVQAFEVVQIPDQASRFRLTVSGPAGREVLKVFATDKPIDYFDVHRLAQSGPYYTVPGDVRALTRDLNVELNEPGSGNGGYGVATQVLQIVTDTGDIGGSYMEPGQFFSQPDPFSHTSGLSPDRLFKLAEAAYYGEGHASIGQAINLYMQAAERGHVLAMVRLGQIFEQGGEEGQQIVKALAWYHKAADLGSTQAMVRLAHLYSQGMGVPQDFAEALHWLDRAAKSGDGLAMARLAKAYDEGRGVPHDPAQAAHYSLGAVRAGAWSVQNDMAAFTVETRQEMQRMLREAGFYHGEIDGVFGPETRQALTEYARSA